MLYARQHSDLSDFDDALVDMVFGYTKLYSHREKAGTSFEITKDQIRLDRKMYWKATHDTFV